MFSTSKLRGIRKHCSSVKHCKKKNAQLALGEAQTRPGTLFCPWTTVSVRIHESNREVGGQVVRHGRQQSFPVVQDDSDLDMLSIIGNSGVLYMLFVYLRQSFKIKVTFSCLKYVLLF